MRFKLWKEGIVREKGDVLIKVEEDFCGIGINVVNEDGHTVWYLASLIDGDGNLCVHSGVGSDPNDHTADGIDLDESGRIRVID